jgi:dTMP kinase
MSGKFIVLDGPDGCGKSTQTRLLSEFLSGQAIEVLSLRDPGTTAIGEKIRAILLNPEHIAMSLRTEVLLYMAARAQVWTEQVAPALAGGKCVLMDRWLSSTCAYQGYAGGFGIDSVLALAQCSLERVWPDLTLILDADLSVSTTRLKANLDRMERKGPEYHARVRQGFLEIASVNRHFVVVNAGASIESVHSHIAEIIRQCEFNPEVSRCKC